MPNLTIDDQHVYRLDGKIIDGVTQIMHGAGIMETEWVTPSALSRGRAVHYACHLIDTDGLDWDTLHPELHGYVRAWERCKSETGMEIIDSEVMRYHPKLLFAGTRDKRVVWNKDTFKLDLKTVKTIGAAGPKWAKFQIAAYDILDPSPDRARPDRAASIILYPDGTWRPEVHNDYNAAACFISFLTTFRCLKSLGRIA